jgi:tellurite resistance protein TerC
VLHVTAAGWAATIGLIAVLLAPELGGAGRRPHAVGFREAVGRSVHEVGVAIGFGVVFGIVAGWDSARSISPATSSRRGSRSTTCSCSA